ncbi:MAG: SIS domain-containing protein [Desulfovibrionaceae bacterium]|nr:SIS domain-containing protein [Desulfovibrionaceae bacterium]
MPTEVLHIIAQYSHEGASLREAFFTRQAHRLQQAALCIAKALGRGNTLLLCGTGGSASVAQELAAAFTHRLVLERPPLPALALAANVPLLTGIANESTFSHIFALQVQALGKEGDVLLAFAPSPCPCVLEAVQTARGQGMLCIVLFDEKDSTMAGLCDIALPVPPQQAPLVQEVHSAAGHALCRLVDYYLFENAAALTASNDFTEE